MIETIRDKLAQLAILGIAAIMSLGALVFCWIIWRKERRKRIRAVIGRWFEAVAVVIVGPLDEEYLDALVRMQSNDSIWR